MCACAYDVHTHTLSLHIYTYKPGNKKTKKNNKKNKNNKKHRTHVHEAPGEVALDVDVVELDGLVHLGNVTLHEPLPEGVVQRLKQNWLGVLIRGVSRA